MNKLSLTSLYALFAIITYTFLLTACGKSDEAVPTIGSLSVYNASVKTDTYDVYLNNTKLNSANLPWGGGVKYTQLAVGTYEAKFNVAGETTTIYTKNGINITNNTFSTLYLVGGAGSFDALLLSDDFAGASTEKAYVRFINLSPDATSLDLRIKDATTNIAANQAYKSYSGFIAIDPGAKVLEIKETVSGTVKTALESETYIKGRFYTVIAGGKITPGANERAFSAKVILHQ